MAGTEREFMGTLEMLPPRDREHSYLQPDNSMMRDFWRSTSDSESLQEMRQSGGNNHGGMHIIASMQHSLQRPYSYGAHGQLDHPTMEVARSSLGSSHDAFYTDYGHACHHLDPDSATSGSLIPAHHATYTNFFTASCVGGGTDHHGGHHGHHNGYHDGHHDGLHDDYREMKHERAVVVPGYMTAHENLYHHHGERYPSLPPVAIPMSHNVMSTTTTTVSESITHDHDMDLLRRELAYKCPRSSDLLMAITSAADATVREHASGVSGASTDDDDDDDDAPDDSTPRLSTEHDQELRAAIVDHPYYPEMVVAHIRIYKIGAPKQLRNKLDDVTKKFQRFQEGGTMHIGDDPSLDFFMRSYVDLLAKLGEDLEETVNKFMQFKDATTKALENICGHYIETGPDETDNYGFDIGPMDGAHDSDELDMLGDEGLAYSYGEVDESIVIDPTAPDEELRKMLMKKYGRHIGGLKAEFNRVRKKGKLPSNARAILKDWFNRHSFWPYPSEVEKQYLQRVCCLNLKQINNWFINERKRHWSCEGKCMHPNAKLYNNHNNNHNNSEGKGHLEHRE